MKKIVYLITIITLIGCNPKQLMNSKNISREDSIKIEKNLIYIKNWSFRECYSLSEINTYKRLGLKINDSCSKRVNDLTGYYYINNTDIDLHYIFEDKNRQKLVNKWVNKAGYTPFVHPPDFPEGSLDMVRALDFYNSDELRKYIDSIRQVEIKNILLKK